MIYSKEQLSFKNEKLCIILGGVAGIGKTTLALSAPKPLLIDLDNGIKRVAPRFRKDTDIVSSYEELINDLNGDLSAYETIVVDTGGRLLEFLKPVVIKENIKNGQTDGTLSLKGYGAVAKKFSDIIKLIKAKGKHLILIFHATEVQLQNDTLGLRIDIEGKTKNEVWKDCDIGGFVVMENRQRVLKLGNTDSFYGKASFGLENSYVIPTLTETSENTFLTDLINVALDNLEKESRLNSECEEIVEKERSIINSLTSEEEINNYYKNKDKIEQVLSSKTQALAIFKDRIKQLGFVYDKKQDKFVINSNTNK